MSANTTPSTAGQPAMSYEQRRAHELTGLRMDHIQARNHLKCAEAARAASDRARRQAVADAVAVYSARMERAAATLAAAQHVPTVPVPLDDSTAAVMHSPQPAPIDITGRMEPSPQPWTWRDSMRAAAAVLLIAGAVLVLTACGGGDAGPEEAAQHDAQMTPQPVACAASGCAK